jgi:adenylate kinase
MITVVLTGMTGGERRNAVDQLARFAQTQGRNVAFIDVWHEMQAAAASPISEATVLNIAEAYRSRILQEAFANVQRKLEELRRAHPGRDGAVIVGTHATFFWSSSYLEGFSETLLTQLQPEALFTVEHNVVDTFNNLRRDIHHRFDQVTLFDVLHWRDRETEETARWARSLRVPHYLVSRSEPVEGFFTLLFERHRKKVYASYPMSYVTDLQRRAAEGLVHDMRAKGYVVFNPGALEDIEQVGSLLDQRQRRSGPLASFSDGEVANLLRAVGNHTVKRDFRLIDQSDLVVVYYPSVRYQRFDTQSQQVSADTYIPLSAGVICEIVHGHASGKRVYAVWLPKYTPSPFFTYHVFRIASTKRQLLKLMAQLEPP